MLLPLAEVLTILQTLYKLGTTEEGEGLSLKPEDFYSQKLMNKITKQLQVSVTINCNKENCYHFCVSLGPPGVVQRFCTHMVPYLMHNISDTHTVQCTSKLVPFNCLQYIKVLNHQLNMSLQNQPCWGILHLVRYRIAQKFDGKNFDE